MIMPPFPRLFQALNANRVVAASPQTNAALAYRGNLDTCAAGVIAGWAYNPNAPQEKLVVEFCESGKWFASACADQYREDLSQHGIGDGSHAFSLDVSRYLRGGEDVHSRIVGSGTALENSPAKYAGRQADPGQYTIFADIVNNCNLRCPFCLTDYRKLKKTDYMSRETYSRFIEMLPYAKEGGFMLSCVHEPTLHPHLPEFLRAIPAQYRRKVMLTTNMAREKFSDDLIDALAHSGLHHINVSFDSLNPETFAVMRKNGKFATFRDNLERLVASARTSATPPALRYITILSKLNVGEIAEIVATTTRKYLSIENEIREPQVVPHMENEWKSELLPDDGDWERVMREIDGLGHGVKVCYEKYPSFLGNLDSCTQSAVSGWAMNERRLGEAVEVTLSRRGELLGTVLANQFRPDLLAAGIGTGNYGFSFAGYPPCDPAEIEVGAMGNRLVAAKPAAAPQSSPSGEPLSFYVYPDGRLEMRGTTGFLVNINLIGNLPGLMEAI